MESASNFEWRIRVCGLCRIFEFGIRVFGKGGEKHWGRENPSFHFWESCHNGGVLLDARGCPPPVKVIRDLSISRPFRQELVLAMLRLAKPGLANQRFFSRPRHQEPVANEGLFRSQERRQEDSLMPGSAV